MKHILIAGGDKRNVYLANSLSKDGFKVKVIGFDDNIYFNPGVEKVRCAEEHGSGCALLIFGIPASFDGVKLWTPLSDEEVMLEEIIRRIPDDCIITGGRINLCPDSFGDTEPTDYTTRCDFAWLNAVPTAEGAIAAVMSDCNKTLADSLCAITGFGRCSEVLAQKLKAFGCSVHIYARSTKDLSHAAALGFKAYHLNYMKKVIGMYDIIFNSVPFGIFDAEHIENIKENCIFADIASAPGGIAENTPKDKINYKFLPGLPGAYSPESAAEIIKKVIMTLIQEKGKDTRQWLLKD